MDESPLGDVTPEQRAAWDAARLKRREAIRSLRPRINAARMTISSLESERDDLIREATLLGVSAQKLAEDAAIGVARIYQILGRRR